MTARSGCWPRGLRLARLENLDALPAALAEELELALDVASVQVELCGMAPIEIGGPAGETLRIPISAHGIGFGSLTLGSTTGRSFSPEDRVVAAKLALQAGVAADNQRLLALERERAALHAELEHTRTRLDSHLRNVNQILDSQETERREIARQLHDQAAQAMAGVLFGLHVLERDTRPGAHTQAARGGQRHRSHHAGRPSPARAQRAATIA